MMTRLSVKEEGSLPTNNFFKMALPGSTRQGLGAGLLALLCLLVLAGLAGCDQKASETEVGQAPTEVGVVTLHPESVMLTTELSGRTTASLVADVRPQVDGIVRERLFREGSEVKAGDILYRIDPSTYQAAYDSAVAALQQAQAALPSSESKAKRYAELIRHKAISSQDYEDAKATYEGDKAAVAAAKADIETARINLDHTVIRAPISGRVEKSDLTPGTLVTANQSSALTTIRRLDPINVDVTQSSSSFLDLRQAIAAGRISTAGSTVSVQLKLENGTIYPQAGTLEFSEANVDESTGTYTVRAEFPNPDRLLLPGMYVRAIVQDGVVDNCFLVPQRAVTRNTKGEPVALFVGKDGKVEQRVLSVSRNIGNSWLVDSGLNDGDQIIVQGSQYVGAGQAVVTKEMVVVDATGEVIEKPAAEAKDAPVAPSDGSVDPAAQES
jgi:membrane fusion protein (multidrug efflux system)